MFPINAEFSVDYKYDNKPGESRWKLKQFRMMDVGRLGAGDNDGTLYNFLMSLCDTKIIVCRVDNIEQMRRTLEEEVETYLKHTLYLNVGKVLQSLVTHASMKV